MRARYTVGMTRIAALFLLFTLAGCGNKGPLVMPDPAAAAEPEQQVEAPAVVPPTEPVPAPADGDAPASPEPVPGTSGTPAR